MDVELVKLKEFCFKGWPQDISKVPQVVQKYYKFKNNIHLYNDILFFDDRIIVPLSMRNEMLSQLHANHFGIIKTQQRAKTILFWPGINEEIKKYVSTCKKCMKYQSNNVKEPLILRELPDLPFQKVASDILEFGGHSYLVIIDYFSKWLEIIDLPSKTASAVIKAFKQVFSTHGIPIEVFADNMPFNSFECQQFAKCWGFVFKTSSPRYPRSNGLAERAVQIAKQMLRKCEDLDIALLEYRATPISGLEKSPAELLYSRRLNSLVPMRSELLAPPLIIVRRRRS